LKRAIESDPNSALAYVTLGSAYNSMKRYDAALEALSVFPSVSADNWQVHYELARSYVGLRNYESGLREINYSLRLARQDPAVLHLAKAHVLLGLHRNSEAVPELETILRTQPHGPYAPEAQSLLATLRSHDQR
jgi:tetratricopeptide (TPR) repeat protein